MNKKNEIIEAALSLFLEKGYEGVSMRDISSAVNIKAASLYYHFKDKQTLFSECARYFFQKWDEWMADVFSLEMSLEEIICQLCMGLGQDSQIVRELYHADTQIGQYHFVLDAATLFPETLQPMQEANRAFLDLLALKVEEAKAGEIIKEDTNAETIYYLLSSLLEGTNIMQFTDPGVDFSEEYERVFHVIWNGIKN